MMRGMLRKSSTQPEVKAFNIGWPFTVERMPITTPAASARRKADADKESVQPRPFKM